MGPEPLSPRGPLFEGIQVARDTNVECVEHLTTPFSHLFGLTSVKQYCSRARHRSRPSKSMDTASLALLVGNGFAPA